MANYNVPANPFKNGNQHYKKIVSTGRPKKYDTPAKLWQAACTYFEWCQDTPIRSHAFRRGKLVTVTKVREMSLKQLCAALEICNLSYYKTLPEYTRIVNRIQLVVRQYNYIHAAAGFLKGRSVGHAIRKSRKANSTRKAHINKCVTPPSPLEIPIAIGRVRLVKNAIAPLSDTLQKTCIDIRKVRIIARINKAIQILPITDNQQVEKQKQAIEARKVRIHTYIASSSLSKRVASSSGMKKDLSRAKQNNIRKYPIEARKARIYKSGTLTFHRFRPPKMQLAS